MVIDFDCPFCGVYNIVEEEVECISDTEPYAIKSSCGACCCEYIVELSVKAVRSDEEEYR